MQYLFFWNHALFFISWSETARMSFVSSITKFTDKWFFRFNGETFKTEASSKFPHYYVLALGSYLNSPFVTGDNNGFNNNGLKTEILDLEAKEWVQLADYPFSNSNKYVDFFIDNPRIQNLKSQAYKVNSEYHNMPRVKQMKVSWSLAAIQMVHLDAYQQLPNTRMEIGRISET